MEIQFSLLSEMVSFQRWISLIIYYVGVDNLYKTRNDFLDQSTYYKYKTYIPYNCFFTRSSICKTNKEHEILTST